MIEEFPVVRRVGASGFEVHHFRRIKLLGSLLDHPESRLVGQVETEAGVLQLRIAAHHRRNTLEWIVDELRKVADERMIEVLEVKLPELEHCQREERQVEMDKAHEVAHDEILDLFDSPCCIG